MEATPQTDAPEIGLVGRMTRVFYAPVETFASLARKQSTADWLVLIRDEGLFMIKKPKCETLGPRPCGLQAAGGICVTLDSSDCEQVGDAEKAQLALDECRLLAGAVMLGGARDSPRGAGSSGRGRRGAPRHGVSPAAGRRRGCPGNTTGSRKAANTARPQGRLPWREDAGPGGR